MSWAFPDVSGLAGMRWFTLQPCCLPRTHGQLPASCLPLCVLALPSRQLPGYGCQKSSFLRKGQVTSSHLCQYLCFLFSPFWVGENCTTECWEWNVGSLEILLDLNRKHPWASLDGASNRVLFTTLWGVMGFKRVQGGSQYSCFLGFPVHLWSLAEPDVLHGRERRMWRKILANSWHFFFFWRTW